MSDDPRNAAASGRGRHHIANVAHHFLGRQDGPGDAAARAVVVAGAEAQPLTAFVAAGAARTGAIADGGAWGLLEEAGTAWSARTHLGGDERVRLLPAAGFDRGAIRDRGLCWHVGSAAADRLDGWAAAARLPGCALPTAGRPVHLFWCLATDTAAALSPLGALARLAALADPRRVDLIVAPRGWPHRVGAGAASADDGTLARLRSRAADLCGRPVRLGVVGPGMGTAAAAALVTEFLHEAAAAGS